MLFGGLFSAYVFLRIAAPEGDFDYWGSKLNVPMATFNTMVLITSSVTMVMSWASLKLQQFDKYKMYLGITILCGLANLDANSSPYKFKVVNVEMDDEPADDDGAAKVYFDIKKGNTTLFNMELRYKGQFVQMKE